MVSSVALGVLASVVGVLAVLVLGTLAGLVGSLLLFALSRAWGWTWLFEAPLRGRPRAAVAAPGTIRS